MPDELSARLIDLVRRRPDVMQALRAVRSLRLASWCIGAGVVRNLVWDALHDAPTPTAPADVDVAYFDASCVTPEADDDLQRQLSSLMPDVPWEVTNQAGVHLWFERVFGQAVAPFPSLQDAISTWPEYATCVGLTLADDDAIHVIAPHGLGDLFDMVVRRNPRRVSLETYRQRVAQKQYATRWPGVRVVAC